MSGNDKQLETPLPELDLFAHPLVQKSVIETLDTVHNPTTYSRSWSTSNIIEFVIDLAENEYMLMHETSVYLGVLFTKKGEGSWTPADAAEAKLVTPVNNLLHSAIDRVQIKIGTSCHLVDISDYAYKAYLSTLLGYNETAKDTHLRCAGWEPIVENRRSHYIKELVEAKAHLRGKLFYDFEHQCKGLIGGSRITIKITLKSPKFFLMVDKSTKGSFGAELEDVRLYVKRYRVADSKVKAHNKALQTVNAKYPLTTSEIKTFSMMTGSTVLHCDNVVTGKMPTRMFLGFVSKNSYTGTFDSDPFMFEPFDIQSISTYVDGVQVPNRPCQLNIEEGDVVDAYYSLFETLNQHDADTVCEITMDEWMEHSCIFGFNYTPDHSCGYSMGGHWNPIKQGHLRIEVRFAKPLPHDVYMIAFCEFDTLYEVDEFKNLILKR